MPDLTCILCSQALYPAFNVACYVEKIREAGDKATLHVLVRISLCVEETQ